MSHQPVIDGFEFAEPDLSDVSVMPSCGLGRVIDPSSLRRASCDTVMVSSSQFHGRVVWMNG